MFESSLLSDRCRVSADEFLGISANSEWPASCSGICRISPLEIHALANRVRGEFIEMPGLHLTMAQAVRLWGLDMPACRDVIDVLVRSKFLRWTLAGTVRRIEG